MEWLDRHHDAVVRTATGVVLIAGAITGVVGSLTFHDLANDNAAKQAQIDALAHQLQQHGPSALPTAPAQAGPTGGTKVVQQPGTTPTTSPSPGATVLLLANSQGAPVVPAQNPGGTPSVPLAGGGVTTPPAGGNPGGHPTGQPTGHPTGGPTGHPTGHPTPHPSPVAEGPISSLVDTVAGTVKKVVAPIDPKPKPSQTPLSVLYLIPVTRRHS